CAIGHSSGYIV
nr:immunoglobulin light chain junction region [Macaca mulatta]